MQHSTAFLIVEAIGQQLAAMARQQGVLHLDNPALPLNLRYVDEKRDRAIFHLQAGDRLLGKPGQRDQRSVRILVGAAALTEKSRRDADALHFLARMAMRGDAWRAIVRAQVGQELAAGPAREVDIEGQLTAVTTEGAGFISAFEIEYQQPYPVA